MGASLSRRSDTFTSREIRRCWRQKRNYQPRPPGSLDWQRRVVSIWRDYEDGGPIMKKLGMLGIIVGAAILAAAPLSPQWSQKKVALSLDSAQAREGRPLTATSVAGVSRRAYRRAVYGTAYGYNPYTDCGYVPYGFGWTSPCGYYTSTYTPPYGFSYAAPNSYYGPSGSYRRPSRIFY
jgi:hypothetical protein